MAGQILLGKEIFDIKLKAGICGAGGDRRSRVQFGRLKPEERSWDALCKKELGITRPTADRYIKRFEKAFQHPVNESKAIIAKGDLMIVIQRKGNKHGWVVTGLEDPKTIGKLTPLKK